MWSNAQQCGTVSHGTPNIYPQVTTKSAGSDAACVNVFFHMVRNSNGTNAFTEPDWDGVIRKLNEQFSPHFITFNFAGRDFINNSNLKFISGNELDQLFETQRRNDAINYYVVNGINGASGVAED